jgi:aconitate hydratase
LGVRAVIAESFERIHRSNLVQMGVLPLQLPSKGSLSALQLCGDESIDIVGLAALEREVPEALTVQVHGAGTSQELRVRPRIDTPAELSYFTRGGILPALMSDLTG